MSKKTKPRRVRPGKVFHLKVAAQTQSLETVRQFVTQIAQQMPFSEEDVFNIELAVDEAATNVVQHAYKRDHKRNPIIEVIVQVKPDCLEVIIGDYGVGFDPARIQQHDIEEYMRELKRGGLGLFLIQKLMDEVSFHIQPGKRNEVRMVKYVKLDGAHE